MRLSAALLGLLAAGAARGALAAERLCPSGYVPYEIHQPGSPYLCVKPQAKPYPEPDRVCLAKAQLARQERRLRARIFRPSCEAAAGRALKALDCFDLQSIRDFKAAVLARVSGDDGEAEAMAKALCPITGPLACMNPEPQCRTRTPPPNLTPWRRPWDDQDLSDVAGYYKRLLPISGSQAAALALRYKDLHPGYWTVDDLDDE